MRIDLKAWLVVNRWLDSRLLFLMRHVFSSGSTHPRLSVGRARIKYSVINFGASR
jgi:hypothetical protein